ncbi:leucine-rich repeat protein [Halothermothrix orenii H 168]|uniref:Leucine-rich repeat protein n=2 Tax=Halothermothrix orenii TaxID=31909 RepID=B8CZL2_HALOH|nr:leucine-rich repeat protein [Halothermothrix orenii H 168]
MGKEDFINNFLPRIYRVYREVDIPPESFKHKGQKIIFGDKNLEQYIKGLMNKKGDSVYEAEVKNIKRLHIPGDNQYRIKSLNGLEFFSGLQELIISRNDIKDLNPLTKLKNIKELRIHGIPVKDYSPLGRLKKLKVLTIWGYQALPVDKYWPCRVRDLSFLKNLTDLEYLEFKFNDIKDLSPLANLTRLKHLKINYDRVSNLDPISGLTGLVHLDLVNNNIEDISPLVGLKNLEILDLSGNRVKDITPLLKLCKLKSVTLKNNHFKLDIEVINKLKDRGVKVEY